MSPIFSKFAPGGNSGGQANEASMTPEKLTKMLVAAIIKSEAANIKTLAGMGAELNRSDEKGNSPLVIAATDPREYISLRALLDLAADPNAASANGRLPLHSLLRMKDERIMLEGVDMLLSANADPNLLEALPGQMAMAPLQIALVSERSDKIIDALLKGGANPCAGENAAQEVLTPLHILARQGRYPLLETAFAAGADIDRRDFAGRSCLIWAAREGMIKTIEALLERNADPTLKDDAGRDAIIHAQAVPADAGRGEIIRMLTRAAKDFTVRADIRDLRRSVENLKRDVDAVAHKDDDKKA